MVRLLLLYLLTVLVGIYYTQMQQTDVRSTATRSVQHLQISVDRNPHVDEHEVRTHLSLIIKRLKINTETKQLYLMQASRCRNLSAVRMAEIDYLCTSHSRKHLPQIVRSTYLAIYECSVQRRRPSTCQVGATGSGVSSLRCMAPAVRQERNEYVDRC